MKEALSQGATMMGRFYALKNFVIGILLLSALTYLSVYLIRKPKIHTEERDAVIVSDGRQVNENVYIYEIKVKPVEGDDPLVCSTTFPIEFPDGTLQKGQSITVFPSSENNCEAMTFNDELFTSIGYGLLVVSILSFVWMSVKTYLVFTYDGAAKINLGFEAVNRLAGSQR